ncbi:hematopoietic SH2 domain-containing protein [Discoglossus pictus]
MELDRPSVKWFIETQSDWFLQNGIPNWFHGVITRKYAEDLLKDKPAGCFLIRVGESRIGYSLSYKAIDRFRHFMIDVLKDQECNLSGDTRIHKTLEDLVRCHTQYPILPYNEILTVPCGQKTQSEVDYHELFEHVNSHLVTDTSSKSNVSIPAPGPVHNVMGSGGPPKTVTEEVPPLPPRRIQSDSFPVIMNIPSPAFQTPVGTRLYPSLPQELPQMFMSNGQVHVIPRQQAHGHRIMKSHSVDSLLLPNTAGNANIITTTHIVANHNNQHNGTGVPCNRQQNPTKPFKACRNFMTKAASLVTEGQIVQDLKSMENSMATRMRNINIGRSEEKQKVKPKNWVPEEYKQPPPFAPGFC